MEDVQPGRARFDPALQAWVLSSHEDVSAALRESRLTGVDSPNGGTAHLAVQEAVTHTLSGDHLRAWRAEFERTAWARAAALPTDRPVDLLATFALPWALSLAVTVTGARPEAATDLARLAREVFLAAASRTNARGQPEGDAAAAELAQRLPPAKATIGVQTFVALSQTLPHLLAGVWLELFGRPATPAHPSDEPGLSQQALEELLRLAGPARAVFRHALAEVRIGQASIRRGDRVVLMLAAANRDRARFPDADRINCERAARDHVAFGAGAHACSGARLIRAATAAATDALLRTTAAIEIVGPVTWLDGFAIRAPASLPAILRAGRARGPARGPLRSVAS